jgi:hypothetical protein
LYRYLVQGNLNFLRFRWVDATTSDNYGVLRITVERANPSESAASGSFGARLLMLPNVPDPFNPSTTIRYVLPRETRVSATIFDVRGHVVRQLATGTQPGGYRTVSWDGTGDDGLRMPSGVYYASIAIPSGRAVQKLVLVK